MVSALDALAKEQASIEADLKNAIAPSKVDVDKLAALQAELADLIAKGKSEKPLTFPDWAPPPTGAGIEASTEAAKFVSPAARGTFSAAEAARFGQSGRSPMEAHLERTGQGHRRDGRQYPSHQGS